MKHFTFLGIAIFGLFITSMAHPVDKETARTIATKFMKSNDAQLSITYQTDRNTPALYVFNTSDGFVIISADDCETPIIGYSHEGRFDPNNVPVQMEEYLQDFVGRIQHAIENHIEADEITARQWELVKSTGRLNERKNAKAVEPLLTEKWHQGCLYNSLCPAMSGPCDRAELGCVAVAMGQIMHYWKYPSQGFGSHSYSNQGVTLSADFGSTSYDWELMPDSLTDDSSETEIMAVATLLYHCGISVDMSYTTNGSGAHTEDVPKALVRYFSYSKRVHFEKQSNYSDEEWRILLEEELDQLRPVLYKGSSATSGHAFVCDGYDDDGLFHFNWGWGTANGYFTLDNPNGYNRNNAAVVDIIPQYEPCHVYATAVPSTAGTIEGAGEYHIGGACTLTALPTEDYALYFWKKDGQIVSNAPSYTFNVESDTINIEAYFSCSPVSEITASYSPEADNPNSTSISLSWNYADPEWKLLKQFELDEEVGGIATDDEYFYVTFAEWNNPPYAFGKYTMEGDLIEKFNIEGITDVVCLAYDGAYFYCNNAPTYETMYCVDLDNKTILGSTEMDIWFGTLTYDPRYDGFWMGHNYQFFLYNRQGQRLKASPATQTDYINGTGCFNATDGTPHLIVSKESAVYDYDIDNNFVFDRPLISVGEDPNPSLGTCTGKYDGKDAVFIVIGNTVNIFEINCNQSQITGYRIYRADSEGNTVMLADAASGTSFTDDTWGDALAGMYRFGISEVYLNGNESDIIWSDYIEKNHFDTEEHQDDPSNSGVRKVIEDNKIVIIKDGKRYTVWGQRLN